MNGNGVNQGPIETREIEPRDRWRDPLATTEFQNQWYTAEEAAELKRRFNIRQAAYRKQIRDNWERSPQGELCLAFYSAFLAYKDYLEQNDRARWTPDGPIVDYDEHKLFQQALRIAAEHDQERSETLRKNLEKAQRAARCQHIHTNGEQCGAPRVRGRKLCHMHERIAEAKAEALDLGSMEDPDSIQVSIQKLQKAIIDGKLTGKQVGQLAYTIQLAAWNVTRTSLVQSPGSPESEKQKSYRR
jgi:hypothetical protein